MSQKFVGADGNYYYRDSRGATWGMTEKEFNTPGFGEPKGEGMNLHIYFGADGKLYSFDGETTKRIGADMPTDDFRKVEEEPASNDPMMKFVEDTIKMRMAQKLYFATRSRESLIEAKRLEKEVDTYIAEFYT